MFANFYKIIFVIYFIFFCVAGFVDGNGLFSLDTISSIEQILGRTPPSNWHPVAYTFGYLFPFYFLFKNFSAVVFSQAFLAFVINCLLARFLIEQNQKVFNETVQPIQLLLFIIYLFHPLQFNFLFIVWKDTPNALISLLCLILYLVNSASDKLLLPFFTYAQLLRHFGVAHLFVLAPLSLFKFFQVKTWGRVVYLLPIVALGLGLYLNVKFLPEGQNRNSIVEALGMVNCSKHSYKIFCSPEAIKSKSCFSPVNIDTCISESRKFDSFWALCKANFKDCQRESDEIHLKEIPAWISIRTSYIWRMLFHPFGSLSGNDGATFLLNLGLKPPFPMKSLTSPGEILDAFYKKITFHSAWSHFLGFICLIANIVFFNLYKQRLSDDLRERLKFAIFFNFTGVIMVFFGPFVAAGYRYLWPYMHANLIITLLGLSFYFKPASELSEK